MKNESNEILRISAIFSLILIGAFSVLFLALAVYVSASAADKPSPYGEPVEFEATAYCWTGNPTKSGVYPMEGRTIAVDPKVIPLGSTVIVYTEDLELLGIFQAEDTGGAVKGRIIDIYMDKESDCWEWGRQKVFVQVVQAEG